MFAPLVLFATLAIASAHPWENEPSSRWDHDFSGSPRDGAIPLPTASLEGEKVGTKTTVQALFDRWTLNSSVNGGRGTQFAEITRECKGRIELNFALGPDEWQNSVRRKQYFRDVNALIDHVGSELLHDYGDKLAGTERIGFLRALHALAWQETLWQHYVRYKNWFFVELSGGSYNVLDDWGITQVARSGATPEELLNPSFFASKGHCSIASTFYYGFLEYYFTYLEARTQSCNAAPMEKLVGAYNEYSSGFSTCHDGLSPDKDYRAYQLKAMGGFTTHFNGQTWLGQM